MEDNKKATEYKKGGLYYDTIKTGFSEFTAKMNPLEQNFAGLRQEYLRLTRIINTGTGGSPLEAQKERVLLKPKPFTNLNPCTTCKGFFILCNKLLLLIKK